MVFQDLLETHIEYGLLLLFKIYSTLTIIDYSYLKQSPFSSIFACKLFVQKCDILLGGPRFVTVCDGGQKSSKIT